MSVPEPSRSTVTRRRTQAVLRRRQLRWSAAGILVLVLLAWLVTVLVVPLPSASTNRTIGATVSGTTANVSTPAEGTTAVSSSEFGYFAGEPGHDKLPIASITKVITALMVLRAHPLTAKDTGPTITFGESDVALINDVIAQNGKFADIAVGDTTTERDALYVMLLKSANNIASSLAVWAYGSLDAYLAETNAWLAEQGLTETVVVDASGLNSGTQSSPANLLAIAERAMSDPVLASIVGTKEIELPVFGKLVNGNTILGLAGIDGVKTGTTDEAGSCLLYSATFSAGNSPIHLFGITTGAHLQADLQAAVAAYVSSIEQGFHNVSLANPAVPVANVTTPWNTTSAIVPEKEVKAVTWSDTAVAVSVVFDDIRGGAKGTRVGQISFDTPEGKRDVPLILAQDLEDPGPLWRISHVAQLFG